MGRESGSGLERSFFHRRFNNVLGQLAAFTALRGYAQFPADVFKGTCTCIDEFLDLAIGYRFAKTDIHDIATLS